MDNGTDLRNRYRQTNYVASRQRIAPRPHAPLRASDGFRPPTRPMVTTPSPVPVAIPVALPVTTQPVRVNAPTAPPVIPQTPVQPAPVELQNQTVPVTLKPQHRPAPISNEFVQPKRPQPSFADFRHARPLPATSQPPMQAVAPAPAPAVVQKPVYVQQQYASAVSQPTAPAPAQQQVVPSDNEEIFDTFDLERDNQPQPRPQPQQILQQFEQESPAKLKKSRRKAWVWSGSVAMSLLVVGAGFWGYRTYGPQGAKPQTLAATVIIDTIEQTPDVQTLTSVQSQVKYPIYYVKTLPKDYSVDNNSYAVTKDLFNFIINTPTGKAIPVVEQKYTNDFVVPGLNSATTVNIAPQDLRTDIGEVKLYADGETIIGAIANEKTIILLNLSGIPGADCVPILKGFSQFTVL